MEVTLDGKSLEKNKEYKLSVGQTLKIGDDAVYQVEHFSPSNVSVNNLSATPALLVVFFVLLVCTATDEICLLQILRDTRAHA